MKGYRLNKDIEYVKKLYKELKEKMDIVHVD